MLPPWHPASLADRLPFLRRRARLTQATRAFFDARGYTEVETPYAVPAPGEEVHLLPFATERILPTGASEPLYLHTSPEFAMKRLLVAGAGPIFQLARVWRNGERSRSHAPEFTMLEWYRPDASLASLIEETHAYLRALLSPSVERIEPQIGWDYPTFLTHWPAAQAALAVRDPADPRVALRFELYVGGLELANAFEELIDAAEQRARFEADRARRHALTGPDWPLDEDFLAALAHGMPPASGIALGFDRLVMLATGAERIDQVVWLPAPPDPI